MLNVKLGLRRYAFSLRHYNLPLFLQSLTALYLATNLLHSNAIDAPA